MISLQDQLYSCNNVSHDWAHVETQASCLEADTGGFATDYLIRHGSPATMHRAGAVTLCRGPIAFCLSTFCLSNRSGKVIG